MYRKLTVAAAVLGIVGGMFGVGGTRAAYAGKTGYSCFFKGTQYTTVPDAKTAREEERNSESGSVQCYKDGKVDAK